MGKSESLTEEELTRALAYVGLVLIAFELIKSMIVGPIKLFYKDTTFGEGMPFKSYEVDVLSRHKDQFEACLLYLRDFMVAIDSDDMNAIQDLRRHRNELAHDLVNKLHDLQIEGHAALFKRVDTAFFKLSNYRAYIEIGSDPDFQTLGIDWDLLKGHEYLIFENVFGKLKMFNSIGDQTLGIG
ncbi:hypothetical protein P8936_12085 [Edaphobacter paludis]|uniref:HEPN AbiU2-like domain-containing protein n=1 Tax=Edaphobacter paludis TaxID=3035702 RepID=A0AAU7D4G3_9BACT